LEVGWKVVEAVWYPEAKAGVGGWVVVVEAGWVEEKAAVGLGMAD
jgi:hypothetical protein